MVARVVTFHRSPDRLDEVTRRFHEQVAPVMHQQAGFKGAYILVDRTSGKQLGISLWETEEAARGAMAALEEGRTRSAQELGDATPPIVEAFEVVAQL